MASVEHGGWRGSFEAVITASQFIDAGAILFGAYTGNVNILLLGIAGLIAGMVGKDALKHKHAK